jgi:hypothetical protein
MHDDEKAENTPALPAPTRGPWDLDYGVSERTAWRLCRRNRPGETGAEESVFWLDTERNLELDLLNGTLVSNLRLAQAAPSMLVALESILDWANRFHLHIPATLREQATDAVKIAREGT